MMLWAGWAQRGILLPVLLAGVIHVTTVIGKLDKVWMIQGGLTHLSGWHCCQVGPFSLQHFSRWITILLCKLV